MFTNMRHAAARSRTAVTFEIDETTDDTERLDIARARVTGTRTLSACLQHVPERRTDPTLLLTFMLAAAVCAMGILAIHALSIQGLTR
jgi:hypothetical protein